MTIAAERNFKLPLQKSVDRIVTYPIVGDSYNFINIVYTKVKNSNLIIGWTLNTAETSFLTFTTISLNTADIFGFLSALDKLILLSLDVVERHFPYLKYSPEIMYHLTKDYVRENVVQPLKRSNSVKSIGKYSDLAAEKIDSVLDVADKYVDKYLPDSGDFDTVDAATIPENASKTLKTFKHANRFSRKLQRRLTRRTIDEASALKHQSAETLQTLIYLAKLLIRDPKEFIAKSKAFWAHLSEDEPENQVPPKNLQQLIVMLTRETARKVVHVTNYTGRKLAVIPAFISDSFYITIHNISVLANSLLKVYYITINRINSSIIHPIFKQIDYTKQYIVAKETAFSNRVYSSIESSLNKTDKFLDKFLPLPESVQPPNVKSSDNNVVKTFKNTHHFSRKLQRRLVRQAHVEVEAFKKQTAKNVQLLISFIELLRTNPKGIGEQAKILWNQLSENEQPSEVPTNLQDLSLLLANKIAHRFVHTTNFTIRQLLIAQRYTKDSVYSYIRKVHSFADNIVKKLFSVLSFMNAKLGTANFIVFVDQIKLLALRLLENLMSGSKRKQVRHNEYLRNQIRNVENGKVNNVSKHKNHNHNNASATKEERRNSDATNTAHNSHASTE
ncbi:unnamed protein product [Bemisia tabaci]|uniref:Uncharacterized protein n=1 Tax=Bemisia tabaci TaxID=7038 RepID=A0A9P0F6X8_BEMTA|nr:PREDICTED: uncharacterized protein LOC109037349 [Bemisia tabaci]XP_018907494.1 PREDICTED: uncharacterized protein LOC109037349 [Bemisia tabaci]CAH0390498.1 unnamed protein product [Bemisia tabaci]